MIASWLIVVVSLAILLLLGFGVLSLIVRDGSLFWFEQAAYSFVIGIGAGAMLWAALMPVLGAQVRWVIALVACAVVAGNWGRVPFSRSFAADEARDTVAVVLSCLLALQFGILMLAALRTQLGWDALFNWEIKARIAFEHQGRLPLAYFSDVSRSWSHPRYPLVVPFAEFWLYSWLGRVDQTVVKVLFPLFFFAAAAAVCGPVRRIAGSRAALVAGIALGLIPPLTVGPGAVTGYADVPLAAAIGGALACAMLAEQRSRPDLYLLAGVLAAVAAWTKSEGLLITMIAGIAAVLISSHRVPLWARASMIWMPLVAIGPWLVFQHRYGMPEADFPSFSPAVAMAHLHSLPSIATRITRALTPPGRWGLLWPVFVVTLVMTWLRGEMDHAGGLMAAAVVVPLGAYAMVFLFSGWDNVLEHVGVSIERLLTPLAPTALAFVMSRVWPSST